MLRQLVVLAVVGLALSAPSSKIDANLRSKSSARIVVSFTQTTDAVLSSINSMKFANRMAKIDAMEAQLESLRAATQKNVVGLLESRQASFKSLWINNHLYVKDASAELIQEIANFPEVAAIYEQEVVSLVRPKVEDAGILAEWGIDKIQAEEAWALPGGNNGVGAVVGVIDTGARHTHEALRNNWRQQNGWLDAEGGSATPRDGDGHGTHVTGTIAGSNGIGVAPGAQWISCKGLDDYGSGYESDLVECGQFMTSPGRADIVSNSWGGGSLTSFRAVVTAWQAASITPVFALGNSGSSCSSTLSPGNFDNVIGVGSTDNTDTISYFSSRGPTSDGRVKPEISAPGSNIRSAGIGSDSAYTSLSGTSMATPHIAGVVALLKSRNSNLTYEQVKDLLQDNAERSLGSANTCGGIPPTQFPNNVYGHGRVNARASLAAAINSS